METKFDFSGAGAKADQGLVYVKPVAVADLPRDVQEAAEGRDCLFALHNSDGEQLALVAERSLAFRLAQQNDMQAVTLH